MPKEWANAFIPSRIAAEWACEHLGLPGFQFIYPLAGKLFRGMHIKNKDCSVSLRPLCSVRQNCTAPDPFLYFEETGSWVFL